MKTTPGKSIGSNRRQLQRLLLLLFVLSPLHSAHADSATWNLNPISGDWNTATNWTPATVPNGSSDTATFDQSNTTSVSLSASVEVNEIVFDPGASPFTVTVNFAIPSLPILTVSGIGVVNNSGNAQSLVTTSNGGGSESQIILLNNATAGDSSITYTVNGTMNYYNNSTAGAATFFLNGGSGFGFLTFYDSSTLGAATFITDQFGIVSYDSSTIASGGIFINNHGGRTIFADSDAGNTTSTNNGSDGVHVGADTTFTGTATADAAVVTNNSGPSIFGAAGGGRTYFLESATAGNATVIANGGDVGTDGGRIFFMQASTGGTCRIEVFGNSALEISSHNRPGVTIGSIEGDGGVSLGLLGLTVGGNNLTTTYSGVIGDGGGAGGSLTKIGTGTLTLSGVNTYTGGTTVSAGTLLVAAKHGSATGAGTVKVTAGTLGGIGKISGNVTLGTGAGSGAFLSPGLGAATPGALTISKKLTFNSDSTYSFGLKTTNATADQVVAKGVSIASGAQFSFAAIGRGTLTAGTVFTAINNTSANPISGTFANLPDGSNITIGNNTFLVNYEGGNGNDLTITVE